LEALSYLILGLVQGLTEFLPVSSSGHLTLGQAMLGLEQEDLTFTVLVHGATALSTLVVFRDDIKALVRGAFGRGEEGQQARTYIGYILLSAVPAAVVGLGFKDSIEALASPNSWEACSASRQASSFFPKRPKWKSSTAIRRALTIGLAQAWPSCQASAGREAPLVPPCFLASLEKRPPGSLF
jgi:undecaprenyl-diphosphatase